MDGNTKSSKEIEKNGFPQDSSKEIMKLMHLLHRRKQDWYVAWLFADFYIRIILGSTHFTVTS